MREDGLTETTARALVASMDRLRLAFEKLAEGQEEAKPAFERLVDVAACLGVDHSKLKGWLIQAGVLAEACRTGQARHIRLSREDVKRAEQIVFEKSRKRDGGRKESGAGAASCQ